MTPSLGCALGPLVHNQGSHTCPWIWPSHLHYGLSLWSWPSAMFPSWKFTWMYFWLPPEFPLQKVLCCSCSWVSNCWFFSGCDDMFCVLSPFILELVYLLSPFPKSPTFQFVIARCFSCTHGHSHWTLQPHWELFCAGLLASCHCTCPNL